MAPDLEAASPATHKRASSAILDLKTLRLQVLYQQKFNGATPGPAHRRACIEQVHAWERRLWILAPVWQILSGAGFPNQFFCVIMGGRFLEDLHWQDVGLERRAWALSQKTFLARLGSQGAAPN